MAVIATSKSVRISPRKVGIVAGLVKNRSIGDAIIILDHTPRGAALQVKKTILSARGNAEHNHSYKPDSLFIKEISVTAGPRYTRFMPAAFGRARRFQRKTSHIRVVVDGEKRQTKKPVVKTEEKQ